MGCEIGHGGQEYENKRGKLSGHDDDYLKILRLGARDLDLIIKVQRTGG